MSLTEFRKKRLELKLSQGQAAKLLDRPKTTIQKWDSGERTAHKREIKNLQLAFEDSKSSL